MSFLVKLSGLIDRINEKVGRGVAWTTAGLVTLVFIDVVMRYLLNISYVAAQEMEWHLFGFIFLIGAGYTLRHEGHVRVDIIYQRLGDKGKAWVNLFGCILFLFPGCALIIWTSIPFVVDSIVMFLPTPAADGSTVQWIFEGSMDPGGLPFYFILKSCIPVGFVLLLLQGISLFAKSLVVLIGTEVGEGEAK